MSNRIIVTGGMGFIGGAVCAQLRDEGFEPVPIDRDHDILLEPLPPESDGVIHLAGVLGTSELFDAFDLAVDVNIKGTQRVLEYCRMHDVSYTGITMPSVWANVYQATKRCASILATAWHESFDVPVSHVRAFNAYGVGQKHGKGHPQKILPTFAYRAWRGEPIPIWGDGEQTVDLISTGELAKVLVGAMRYGGNDEVFDGGSGEEWTVNSVVEYVIGYVTAHGGPESEVVHHPMRSGEREHTELCASGENWSLLGFKPRLDIVAMHDTIDSYRSVP